MKKMKNEYFRKEFDNLSVLAKDILCFLNEGEENAITQDELHVLTGKDERTIRRAIKELRSLYPIINNQKGNGYYIGNTKKELLRYKKQEESRAKSIFQSLKAVRLKLKEIGE